MSSDHAHAHRSGEDDAEDIAALTRIMLRPVASPIPAGFLALAIGTFTLAGLQLRWIATGQGHVVWLCLFALVAPL